MKSGIKICYYNQIFATLGIGLTNLLDKRCKKWGILSLLWFLLLLYALVFYQGTNAPPTINGLDKMGHIALFFGQFFLLALAIRLNFYHKKAWVGLLLLALILAITTEYAQSLTPTRTMDKYDGLADILGAMLALTFVSFITKQKTN